MPSAEHAVAQLQRPMLLANRFEQCSSWGMQQSERCSSPSMQPVDHGGGPVTHLPCKLVGLWHCVCAPGVLIAKVVHAHAHPVHHIIAGVEGRVPARCVVLAEGFRVQTAAAVALQSIGSLPR